MEKDKFYHILCFTFGYLFHASNFHLLQSNDFHNRANYPITVHKLKLNQKPVATSVTSGFSKLFLYKLSFCCCVISRHATVLLDLVLEHEWLGIPCSIMVLVFCPSDVQVSGSLTDIEAYLTWRTKLALKLVVDTTAAAVTAISLANSAG